MSNEEGQLQTSIGFWMGIAYRKLSALLQQRLKAYGLTPEQWSVLYTIQVSEGLIQKDIAERTHKDKPTTTRILDQLEDKGFIVKSVGENDRRAFVVHATEKGRHVIRETASVERSVSEEVRSIMTAEEYDVFVELLQRIHSHAETKLEG
ncbi:MarR family winged helix-turn-helix transcriptional regulator [Paenibacillus soyae]|uniref:MarR family transcriptional regulator n=1 Tax=Paenibacillus soyae TaxID=2969249 RepID=A0A9X2SC74_9BACL|nr:MarR family transcriptional regulator [Paenibacillus soyae]MCR2806438.1 MarR family transcriptional regulator [Paenibacillus soyae]